MRSKSFSVFLCVIALLSGCSASTLSAETFRNPYRIPTPVDPDLVLVGDINGDGRPDLLWGDTTSTPYKLHILLAQPGGVYISAPDLILPANTGDGCYIADFNKDGRNDLLCSTNNAPNTWLQVILGNGDGTFQAPIATTLPVNVNSYVYSGIYALGDFNNDGVPDALVYYSLDQFYVLLGDGRGGFQAPIPFHSHNNSLPILADLNGDGKLDIFFTKGLSAALGNGDGTFGPLVDTIFTSNGSVTCVLHDMDGDGRPDAVCGLVGVLGAITPGGTSQLIFHGNGDGTFNTTTPISYKVFGNSSERGAGLGTYGSPVAVVDLNGDGIADVLASSGDGLAVLVGGPNLTFSSPQHFALAGNSHGYVPFIPYANSLTDITGDGITDITTAGPNGISIAYGQHDGTYLSAPAYEVAEVIGYASFADFNGDGIIDVVASGDTALKLSLGKGDGTFGTPMALPNGNIDFSIDDYPHILHGDFNGDGKQDILAIGSSSVYQYDSYVQLGHGDGSFYAPVLVAGTSTIYPVFSPISDAAVADLNHDGRSDIFQMNSGSSQAAQIISMLATGNGTTFNVVNTSVPYEPVANGFYFANSQPAVADFNGDGKLDAVYGALSNLYVLKGNGDGSFASTGLILPIPQLAGIASRGTIAVATADFDGDGNQDFVALVLYGNAQDIYPGPNATAALVYYGKGDGTFSAPVIAGSFDRNYSGVATGDLNRDGLIDLVFRTGGTLPGGTSPMGNALGVVHSLPGRSFGLETNYTGGNGLSSSAVADLNGDGYPDMIFANAGLASSVTVLLNSGGKPFVTGFLTASPAPSVFTTGFSLSATLLPPSGGASPTGNIAFSIDGVSMGSAVLSGNVATVAGPTTLAVGVHQLTAAWAGDSNYAALNLGGTHTVTAFPLQVVLTSSLNPSTAGQQVLFSTQFIPSPPAGVDLTGHAYTGLLSFYDGTTLLAFEQVSTFGYNLSTANLSAGTHNITAVYASDGVVAGATSNVVVQVVNALPSTATLTANPIASVFGGQTQLTATVSAITTVPGHRVPAGTVTFYNGSVAIGSASLASGTAGLISTTLPVGTDQLSCEYSGDTTYLSSACNTVAVSIAAPPSGFTLTLSPSTITVQDGQTGAVAIQLGSVGTFAGPVSLTYGALPQYGSVTITPATDTLVAGGTASSSLVFHTVATGPALASTKQRARGWPVAFAVTVFFLVPLGARRRRRLLRVLGVVVAAVAMQGLVGCGDQWFYTALVAPGTYQIPVTATGSDQSSHTKTLTVIVTQ
jgi:Bacterial Ig-like domain (group 3)/FG-GAP-like repeat